MNKVDSEIGAPSSPLRGPKLKFRASMRMFGEHLDFDHITRSLGIQPSSTHRAGETGLGGQAFTHDLWSIEAPLEWSETLDKHLLSLSQMLEPHYVFLRTLKRQAQLRSFCGIISEGRDCAFRLSPHGLRIFTHLDIKMELSLIFLCLDMEPTCLGTAPNTPTSEESEAESLGYKTKSNVTMEITGDGSDLKKISEVLGLPILDREPAIDAHPPMRGGDSGQWSFTCPLPATDKLDSHMRWLGEILLGRLDILRSFKSRVAMLLRCDFATESDTGGVDISPQGLKACAEIDIPLEFSVTLL